MIYCTTFDVILDSSECDKIPNDLGSLQSWPGGGEVLRAYASNVHYQNVTLPIEVLCFAMCRCVDLDFDQASHFKTQGAQFSASA